MKRQTKQAAIALILCVVMLGCTLLSGFSATPAASAGKSEIAPIAGTTDVTVTVVWNDGNDADRPQSVSVNLEAYSSSWGEWLSYESANLDADSNWSKTWNNLELNDAVFNITDYRVQVIGPSDVIAGYEAPVISHTGNNWTITYTHVSTATPAPTATPVSTPDPGPTTQVTVKIEWDDADDADNLRPESVEMVLEKYVNRNYETVDTQSLSESNGWTYTWTDLPADETYNVYSPWIDWDNYGIPASVVDGNNYTFTYTHTPASIPGMDVSVNVVWDDGDDADGERPGYVSVALVKTYVGEGSSQEMQTVTLDLQNSWAYKWENLPLREGNAGLSYSVKLIGGIDGYTASVNGSETTGVWTITLSHEYTPRTDVSAQIVWDDEDNKDGSRPTAVEVALVKHYETGGKEDVTFANVTLNSEGGWTCDWSKIPTVENGEAISYSVVVISEESAYKGYTYAISNDGDAWTLTFSHTPEEPARTAFIYVEISWIDDNDADSIRPDSVTVELLKNGNSMGTAEVTAEGNWRYRWEDLPLADGETVEAVYSVRLADDHVLGYLQPSVSRAGYTWTITNTRSPDYTPKWMDVTAQIVWNDADGQPAAEEDIPVAVTLTLYRNYTPAEQVTVTAADNWTYTWERLLTNDENAYDPNAPISYAVLQEKALGYSWSYTSIRKDADGAELTDSETDKAKDVRYMDYVFTNTAIEEVEVSVNIEWHDGENPTRPDSLTVIVFRGTGYVDPEQYPGLLENEMQVPGTDVVLTNDNWSYTWQGLPKYDPDGNEYVYTVREYVPKGYSVDLVQNSDGTFTLINITCHFTTVTIEKKWVDEGNPNISHPDSITVGLYRHDTISPNDWDFVTSMDVKAEDGWKATLEELPYYDGVLYKLEELDGPEDYTVEIVNQGNYIDNDYCFILTNTYDGPKSSPTPAPTVKPDPTETPAPTAKPDPTATPAPTAKPDPTATPDPTAVPTDAPSEGPKTGDGTNAGLWIALLGISLIGLAAALCAYRRNPAFGSKTGR